MGPTGIEKKYRGRARKLLKAIAKALNEAGLQANPVLNEWKDEDLRIDLYEGPDDDHEDQIGVSFEFMASERWDGEPGGYSFGIQATHASGEMLGGLTPYNHSSEVWVDRKDPEAVETRFRILEDADIGELVCIIKTFREGQKK